MPENVPKNVGTAAIGRPAAKRRKAWDLSLVKDWKFAERLKLQFRGEFFNVLNHPNFANPYRVNLNYGRVDPSNPAQFGCFCATPDVGDANPVIGTGGPRNIQFGMKVIF